MVERATTSGVMVAEMPRIINTFKMLLPTTLPMVISAEPFKAALVDTAVLVARADFMPVATINEGLDRLRKSAPEVCGFVLNNYRTTIF